MSSLDGTQSTALQTKARDDPMQVKRYQNYQAKRVPPPSPKPPSPMKQARGRCAARRTHAAVMLRSPRTWTRPDPRFVDRRCLCRNVLVSTTCGRMKRSLETTSSRPENLALRNVLRLHAWRRPLLRSSSPLGAGAFKNPPSRTSSPPTSMFGTSGARLGEGRQMPGLRRKRLKRLRRTTRITTGGETKVPMCRRARQTFQPPSRARR